MTDKVTRDQHLVTSTNPRPKGEDKKKMMIYVNDIHAIMSTLAGSYLKSIGIF